jgi:predicted metal-binding membrane protein
VLLFPIGVMNLAAMLLVTALVFAEKVLPAGERTARFAAAALIGTAHPSLSCPRRSRCRHRPPGRNL